MKASVDDGLKTVTEKRWQWLSFRILLVPSCQKYCAKVLESEKERTVVKSKRFGDHLKKAGIMRPWSSVVQSGQFP